MRSCLFLTKSGGRFLLRNRHFTQQSLVRKWQYRLHLKLSGFPRFIDCCSFVSAVDFHSGAVVHDRYPHWVCIQLVMKAMTILGSRFTLMDLNGAAKVHFRQRWAVARISSPDGLSSFDSRDLQLLHYLYGLDWKIANESGQGIWVKGEAIWRQQKTLVEAFKLSSEPRWNITENAMARNVIFGRLGLWLSNFQLFAV